MQISVTFRNVDPADNLKVYIKTKLDRFDRFFNNPAEASVVLTVDKFRQIAEINLIGDRLHLITKEETTDMYLAIDTACDKLDAQLKKNKQKISDKRAGGKNRAEAVAQALEEMEESDDDEETEPRFSIETIEYKPMDVEEAIMQIDMATERPFMVFTDARTGKVNVLYKPSGEHLVLIQPQ